ncbi:MAG: TRAP transporter substrate-binding protein DctP [Rhodobacteraceae bacterium]|nr:TRAP transporter substrate-binding protein DctP [Paracoccaceae bacterium]
MERRRFLKTAAAAPLVAGALAAPAIAQGTFRWRMANLYPRGISFGVAYQSFTDRVASASGGRLVIDNVYDGEGVSATEVLSAVKSGLVEMGSPYMALHAGELAAGVVELGLPGGPSRYDQLYAMWAAGGWKEILIDTYASQGMRHLGSVLQPGVYILTKAPVNTLADLKGMKLRAPGAYGAFMRELGVAPVSMAFAEVYTSLATGVIDGCCSSNLVDYRDGKWYEQAKYLYPVAVSGAQASPTVVNQASFDSLPDDLKSILEVANVEHVFAHATLATTTVADAVAEMKAGGASFTALPSDADTATWRAAAAKVGAEYAAADPFSKRLVEAQDAFLAKLGG